MIRSRRDPKFFSAAKAYAALNPRNLVRHASTTHRIHRRIRSVWRRSYGSAWLLASAVIALYTAMVVQQIRGAMSVAPQREPGLLAQQDAPVGIGESAALSGPSTLHFVEPEFTQFGSGERAALSERNPSARD